MDSIRAEGSNYSYTERKVQRLERELITARQEIIELKKQLTIPVINNQRELLIAAAKGIYPHGDQEKMTKLIDDYLQGN